MHYRPIDKTKLQLIYFSSTPGDIHFLILRSITNLSKDCKVVLSNIFLANAPLRLVRKLFPNLYQAITSV